MSKFTSLLKKAGLLALMAFPLGASAEDSITVRRFNLSPEFLQTLGEDNIRTPYKFQIAIFDKEEDAVFPKDLSTVPTCTVKAETGEFFLKKELKIPVVDSLDLYYILYSPNVQMEKGHFKYKPSESTPLRPQDQCNKVMLKNSIGVDGAPVSTQFIFLGGFDSYKNSFINLSIFRSSEAAVQLLVEKETDPDTGETLNPEAKTSAFWTNTGREIPYVVYNDGRYFMKDEVYKMPDAEVPDTICLDYRQAKKVSFGVKDVKGEQMDMRRLSSTPQEGFSGIYFQTKYCTGPVLRGGRDMAVVGGMPSEDIPFDNPIETVDFYALPGEYIFSFWALGFEDTKKNLCPAGLEGRLVVTDAAEQRVDWDLSKYYTLNVKSNVEPGFKGIKYSARNAKASAGSNALLSHFDFTNGWSNMTDPYTRVYSDPEKQGEYQVKIWPAVGYDTVDIKGAIHDYEFTLKPADFNKQRVAAVNAPDMYNVRFAIPATLQHMNAQLNMNGKSYKVGTAPDRPNLVGIPHGAFYDKKVFSYSKLPGVYKVNFEVKKLVGYNDKVYSSDVKEVKVGNADMDVNLSWNRAVVFDRNNAKISYDFAKDVDAFELLRTTINSGDSIEMLYVFDKAGDADLELTAQNAIPQKQVVKVTDSIHQQTLDFINYVQFKLAAKGKSSRYVNVTWNGKDGSSYPFTEEEGVNERSHRQYYAEKGIMDILVRNYRSSESRYTVIEYPFKVDMNECDSVVLPGLCKSNVNFLRGEEPALVHGYHQRDNAFNGEVDLYYLSSPYVDSTKPLECLIPYRNTRRNRVRLLEGSYCAVDSVGTKIYFTLAAETTGNIDFDFANPPEPPTGIEEMPEVEVPVAYYDLSGRRLVAPRKGVNLIRLRNGKIKKVMVK